MRMIVKWQPIFTSVSTDCGAIWVNLTASREDCRDGDSASNFLPDFFTYSCSWTDFFGVAFLVTVSDLRLTFVSDLTDSDLLIDFSALLLVLAGVRAGDLERLRDGLLDLCLPFAGDFDAARRRCSYLTWPVISYNKYKQWQQNMQSTNNE